MPGEFTGVGSGTYPRPRPEMTPQTDAFERLALYRRGEIQTEPTLHELLGTTERPHAKLVTRKPKPVLHGSDVVADAKRRAQIILSAATAPSTGGARKRQRK